MNNEDYVSYELALKLKACGFDEPCNYGYSVKMRLEPEVSFGEPKMVHSKAPKNFNDNRKGIEKGLSFCSAPHVYLAQKWLREKKGIYAYCEPNCLKKWFARAIDLAKNEDLLFDGEMFDSFEKATEYAISAALELIEQEKK